MEINLKSNIDEFIKNIETKYIRQIPFATSLALNKTMGLIRKDLSKEIQGNFNNPIKKIVDTSVVESIKSNKTNLAIALKIRDSYFDGGIDAERILRPHIEGGERRRKRSEHLLWESGKGFLTGKSQTIVGKNFADSFGNLRSGEYHKILSAVGSQLDQYANTPTGKRPKGRIKSTDYFSTGLRNKKTKHLEVGIYKRSGDKITPILLFTKSAAKYRKRFRFYEAANESFNKNFPSEFEKAFKRAVETAR